MTVFSGTEEKVIEDNFMHAVLYFYMPESLAIAGASVTVTEVDFEPHVIVDRELITGQNPRSDRPLAERLIEALEHATLTVRPRRRAALPASPPPGDTPYIPRESAMTHPVKISAILTVRPGKENELKELLASLAIHSRAEPGNLRWDIWRDPSDPPRFLLDELYRDQGGGRRAPRLASLSGLRRPDRRSCRTCGDCGRSRRRRTGLARDCAVSGDRPASGPRSASLRHSCAAGRRRSRGSAPLRPGTGCRCRR